MLSEDLSAVLILLHLDDGFGVWDCGLKAKFKAAYA
jgi:hypothetical protein